MYAKICVQVSTFRNGADFAPGHVRSTQSIKILKESQMPLMSKQNVICILWAVSSSWHKTIKYTTRKTLKKKSQKKRRNRKLLLLLLSALYLPFLSSFLTDHSLPLSALLSFPDIQVAMEKGAPLRSKGKEDKLKGKDDSSTKPKNARKVQFNFEGSPEYKTSSLPKSLGKDDTPFPKGYSGKGGGKGDKIANGGKSTVFKEPQPLELKVEQDLPENVKCMMDCEALDILQGIQDQLPILSKDPEFRLPVPFDKGLQYAKRGVHYANPQAVRQVLEDLTKYGVSNSEICVIANVCPESDEEVFSLVPSLKTKRSKLREPLKGILSELAKLKESANLESQHKQESLHKWGDQHKGEDQHMKESQHEGEDQHMEESQRKEEDQHTGEGQHKGEDQHLDESQHKGKDQHLVESQHKGKDQHMEEAPSKGENQHLEESQHKGEDEHMEGQNKGEDQHLEEIQHKGEDLHMEESQHKEEDQHKEESAHQDSYLTSSKA